MAAKTILLVDDDPLVIQFLEEVFAYAGYTTIAARDGTHALEVLALAHPDLILTALDAHSALCHLAQRTVPLLITDYMMPDMNGLQLAAAVKAAAPTTHVILTTSDESDALEQRAREQHVDTFLPKTEIFDRLADVVHSVLQLTSTKD